MARKSKRMALNEAIRQGQAKIAEGLKTGQMRASFPAERRAEKDEGDLSGPENVMRNPVDKCRALFLKSKEKPMILGQFSQKMKLIALLCAALIIVLALGIWLISLVGTDQPSQAGDPESQRAPVANVIPEEDEQAQKKSRLPGFDNGNSSESVVNASTKESLPPLSRGDNVIWIQSIPMSRKSELNSLEVFFRAKGIETEIIEIDSSNYAVLVTRDGFERNPNIEGTEGHKLLEQIKQLGAVYVKETKDTKFGLKPFQDALGYKR